MESANEKRGKQHNWGPLWLQAFLGTNFFGSCTSHEATPKNELKRYCIIDCQSPACLICIEGKLHEGHNVLKVYKYSRKDAVLKSEMKEHMDCTKIQTYRCNKEPVFVLNPTPHHGSQQGGKRGCDTCSRRLIDPINYRYCSLACKLKALSSKPKRSRKGIPQRASFTA